ncbi:MAG: DUF6377 domain-containing protein [Muribaculum sp.]|nr:DUF6377 domain-containing protein [Muribaculum sp.]
MNPHKSNIRPHALRLLIYLGIAALIIVGWAGCGSSHKDSSRELETTYLQLDKELNNAPIYDHRKNQLITSLKKDLKDAGTIEARMAVTDRLISEYESYVSDSALYYISLNIRDANAMADNRTMQRLKLQRVDIMSHAGLFGDALSEMKSIDRSRLDSTLLVQYYYVYCGLYQYLGEYNNENDYVASYDSLRRIYVDSIILAAPENSFQRVTYVSSTLINSGDTDRAQQMLIHKLRQYEQDTREYAILASILAYSYKRENDDLNYKKYLTLSAISDIRCSTKENMSFRELAHALYEEGDLDRAKHYLQKSFDDANIYSARMRTAQSARMLPVIDTAFDARQKQMQTRLTWLLSIAVALAIVLGVAILFILKQMKKIHQANSIIKSRNEELSRISRQLAEANRDLGATNMELKRSDSIKEEYASLFMQFSSLAIGNLENYQQELRNLAIKGNVKELVKKIDSSNVADRTLKDFYNEFDEAILNIYPNFVEKVNTLLHPDMRIVPKPGTKLNTELRVLALIRIGVTDSEKISEFLRCSLTTVYTYRSKIRKRALNPDTFEEDLCG